MTIRRSAPLALVLALLLPALALAGPSKKAKNPHDKLDHALQQALKKGHSLQTVIVSAEPGEEAVVRALVSNKGKLDREHRLISAFTADIDTDVLESLAASESVHSISLNAKVAAFPNSHESKRGRPDSLRATLGLGGHSRSGSSVTVAVIDSGIANIREFDIAGFYDCTRDDCVSTRAFDDYGHGTAVASLIAGNGAVSGGQYQGVAPGVRLIGFKVLNAKGQGQTDDVIRALEYVVAHNAELGVDVVNLSLGHPVLAPAANDPLVQAVEAAVRNGIVVVCSAGNVGQSAKSHRPGYGGITSPANARSAITVGAADTENTAMRADDTVAEYSSRGPTWYDAYAKPDIVAPGDDLIVGRSRSRQAVL